MEIDIKTYLKCVNEVNEAVQGMEASYICNVANVHIINHLAININYYDFFVKRMRMFGIENEYIIQNYSFVESSKPGPWWTSMEDPRRRVFCRDFARHENRVFHDTEKIVLND